MHKLLERRRFHVGIAAFFIIAALYLLFSSGKHTERDLVTAVVERGDVTEFVSISGFVEAQNAADLAFPVTGIVESVEVTEGDHVDQGQTLVTLERAGLEADRQNAVADLLKAQADREELIAGPTGEARDVTATEVAIAEENLAQTRREEAEKVDNARRTLLSSNLSAVSNKKNEDATAPIVSGTYTCAAEGTYVLDVFGSNTTSGYSYRLSGLESGTYDAFASQPGPFGNCGLSVQFVSGGRYVNSSWTITIPNPEGSSYVTNKNAYALVTEQAENNIRSAEQALSLAEQQATLANADPRSEAIKRADAAVASAQARLAAVDAQLADRVITAPFDGIITNLDVLPGETVTSQPIITLLADDDFDMTARIPEIDITKIVLGQTADVIFDARANETVTAEIHFISPIAVEIDGVAYFEATLTFVESPAWLRSGLNADVDIVVDTKSDVLKIPTRFIAETEEETKVVSVLVDPEESVTTEKEITVVFTGNDGFTAIEGLAEGTNVVAP